MKCHKIRRCSADSTDSCATVLIYCTNFCAYRSQFKGNILAWNYSKYVRIMHEITGISPAHERMPKSKHLVSIYISNRSNRP